MVIQCLLVVIALLCVPCMLIVKTVVLHRQYLWRKHLGTQNFGGIRVGNGPTDDEAEIIQHDQLSQNLEEEPEVGATFKPDPPEDVKVKPVKGEPHILNVSWSLPATWMWELYYTLQFQMKYRPLHAKKYQQVVTESRVWLILDALPDTDYEIQIQAKDEYEGHWSDWTSPVHARTWTAPKTTVVPDISTLGPIWIFPESSGGTKADIDFIPADDSDGVMWVYVLWVMGFFLLITIIMLTVYSHRWTMPFLTKKNQGSVSSARSCSSPFPLLQQPLKTLKCSYKEKETDGMLTTFSPCESYRS
ncbi:uncharacterized protein LOC113643539 [Tachysurus ichikawai]